jgi:hypothetical protein
MQKWVFRRGLQNSANQAAGRPLKTPFAADFGKGTSSVAAEKLENPGTDVEAWAFRPM